MKTLHTSSRHMMSQAENISDKELIWALIMDEFHHNVNDDEVSHDFEWHSIA